MHIHDYLYIFLFVLCFHIMVALYQKEHMVFVLLELTYSLTVMVSVWTTLLHMVNFILFNGWVVVHGIDAPHFLYPFLFQWTSRLFPCHHCYRLHCCKYKVEDNCLMEISYFLRIEISHQQWSKVPCSQHPQHQVLLVELKM